MKRCVIFSLAEDTDEMKALLDTLGVRVMREFVQRRERPHKASFLGPGKIDEVFQELEELEIDLIVVSGVLRPSQHHFLEMKFQKECVDRPGVILRIFADHAHTPEAIAQVTLAKLRYELPFLREWIHKAKSKNRPGFLAGGGYATDVYFEHAKTHARRIEQGLLELSRQREITRRKRREKGYSLVSLAGYTNAGKSALMNKLCESDVLVNDRLFSTLSTTTRKVKGIKGTILMTDTVGFIKDLPPDLVNAFNSTLEEIFYADLILLVLDASEDEEIINQKLATSLSVLQPRVENRTIAVIGNKVDLLSQGRMESVTAAVKKTIGDYELFMTSAKSEEGLDRLRERIAKVRNFDCEISATIPMTNESYSLLSRLRSISEVQEQVVGKSSRIFIRCRREDMDRIIGWLGTVGAMNTTGRSIASNGTSEQARDSTGSEGAPLP